MTHDDKHDHLINTVCYTPEILHIGSTNMCNLRCIHCMPAATHKQQHRINHQLIVKTIHEFAQLGGHTVTFGGGEFFLRPDALSLISEAMERVARVNIETNGTCLSPNDVEWLSQWQGRLHMSVSVDGISADTHDYFRGVNGSFDRTLTTIQLLRQQGISVTTVTVLQRMNKDSIEKLVRTAVFEWDTHHRLLPILTNEGRGRTKDARELSLPLPEVLDFLKHTYWPLWRDCNSSNNNDMYIDIPQPFIPSDIPIYSGCLWGLHMIGLSSDGQIGLCHYSQDEPGLQAGSIKDYSLEKLWFESEFFIHLRSLRRINLQGVCGRCRYGDSCRGLCRFTAYKKYGRIDAPYPTCQILFEQGLFPRSALIDP